MNILSAKKRKTRFESGDVCPYPQYKRTERTSNNNSDI